MSNTDPSQYDGSHDGNHTLTRSMKKVLDICVEKLKYDKFKYTTTFIKRELNIINTYLFDLKGSEILAMIDKFWYECCVVRRNTWSNEIGDVCVDVLVEIIKERGLKNRPHFSLSLGSEKFPKYSCSFNDYFLCKNNFVKAPLKQRVKNILSLFKEEKFEEANKVCNSLAQRMDVVYKILPNLIPDGNFGVFEKIQNDVIPNMRRELKAKLSAKSKVSQNLALSRTTSSTNVNTKSKRTISNTDITESNTNVKKPRTKKKKKKKKARMMMMSGTVSDEDTSEDESENDAPTPILVGDDDGGKTPVLVHSVNVDDNTPILVGDGGSTPVMVNNGNADDGGKTPVLVNNGNVDDNTPILVGYDDGGSTPVMVNNGNADNYDVMQLLQSAAESTVCCNKNRVAENLPKPKPLSDALIKALVGEMNMNGRKRRRSYSHTNMCFVTRRLKLILPKNWLESVKPPLVTTCKSEEPSNHEKDLWETDYERYWNSGDFILRRLKDESPDTPFFVARKLVNGTWQYEPEKKFDLCLGSKSFNNTLRNSNKNPGVQIKNFAFEDSLGEVREDEDKMEVTLDMYDITKLGDCTAKNNDVCDDCYHKLKDSDAFIFNYGAPLRFVLICRRPRDTYTDTTKNFNHRENIHFQHFPMVEFKINYGAMDRYMYNFQSSINDHNCCMQIREKKFDNKWAHIQYDAVNFRFDVYQWGDTAIGNVSKKSIGQVTFELECDIVTKSTLLKKLETERTSSRAKTGLLKKHISVQLKCAGKRCNGYAKYSDEEDRWLCERCTCKCDSVLVEALHMEPYQDIRISEKLKKTRDIWLCRNKRCDIVYDRRLIVNECKNTFRDGIKCKGCMNQSNECDFCTCRDCQGKMELDIQSDTLWNCSNNDCNYAVETHEDKESVPGVLRYYFVKR